MLKELFTVAPGDEPMVGAEASFTEMLRICEEMVATASAVYWGEPLTGDDRRAFYKKDVRVNKLERDVRASIVTHLSGPGAPDIPYSLMLMSLVKDLERLGDYAKNLSEVPRMTHGKDKERVLPDDDLVKKFKEVANFIDELAQGARATYRDSDLEAAKRLTLTGRANAKILDGLVTQIADSDYAVAVAVDLTLGVRFYKRIQGHVLNLLSSILMPLHKLDYFDEDEIPAE